MSQKPPRLSHIRSHSPKIRYDTLETEDTEICKGFLLYVSWEENMRSSALEPYGIWEFFGWKLSNIWRSRSQQNVQLHQLSLFSLAFRQRWIWYNSLQIPAAATRDGWNMRDFGHVTRHVTCIALSFIFSQKKNPRVSQSLLFYTKAEYCHNLKHKAEI